MLVAISERLLAEGQERVARADRRRPTRWPRWSTGTWSSRCAQPSLIVVQDRDWQSLPTAARERVRSLQREYVDLWAAQLRRRHPDLRVDRRGRWRTRRSG